MRLARFRGYVHYLPIILLRTHAGQLSEPGRGLTPVGVPTSQRELDAGKDKMGVTSENGKYCTLSRWEGSQGSVFTHFNAPDLSPDVVSCEIDVFPTEWG